MFTGLCVSYFFGGCPAQIVKALVFTGLCVSFFWAVQPRLYRFWCLLACVFHIFFGPSSQDCIGFGVYWPVCFIFLDCPAQIV